MGELREGTTTLLFTDVEGSTHLGATSGDDAARKAVACAAAIQVDLERARASEDRLPRVRIGLNAGEVIHEDGDLFGAAVSAAARICASAAGDEVLVSEVVKVLAGTVPGVSWEDRGEVTLK